MGHDGDAEGTEATDPAAIIKEAQEEPDAEDSPLVKQLKELDDKYLELEKEYERECQKLLLQFAEKQQPILDERKKLLTVAPASSDGQEDMEGGKGTPALENFWSIALNNHPAVEDCIMEWDMPVLEYLSDIEKEHLEETDDGIRGFGLKFHFAENPYFTNPVLTKEYKMATANPYCGEMEVKEITCTTIDWKPGKDVTVAMVKPKKVKGGGAKKAKQKKEKEEPRPSFFRDFFRNLHPKMALTQDAKSRALCIAEAEGEEIEESDDEENLIAHLMEADHDIGTALRDNVIPFAVRWYTGEAAPEMEFEEDDDEDEEEEPDEEDEVEESDEDDDEPTAKVRGKGKAAAAAPKGKPKGKAQVSLETKPAAGSQQAEECKQQ